MKTERALLMSFFLCFLALVLVPGSDGQAKPAKSATQAAASSEVFAVTTKTQPEGLIHLDVAVRDQAGKLAPGLTEKDFTLLDDGVPQTIVSFRIPEERFNPATDEDRQLTEVVLMLDQVDLSSGQFAAVKSEAIKFLRENGGHLAQPVSVYQFTNTGLRASAKATMDGNALADEIAHNRLPQWLWEIPVPKKRIPVEIRGELWDSALRTVYSIAVDRRPNPGRKVLIWMGFGWPTWGTADPEDTSLDLLAELSTRIREARMTICQIPIWADSENSSFDYKKYLAGASSRADLQNAAGPMPHFALPVLAIQSGGFVLDRAQGIERYIGSCIEKSRGFYSLSFNPPRTTKLDEYHDLKVQIGGLPGQTNTGYYDEPVFYDQADQARVAAKRVTVHELEQMLDAAGGENDSQLAVRLDGLELTERLSSSKLSRWRERLRGKKAKSALTALADRSVFLDPPAAEKIAEPAPNEAAQVQILSKAVQYLDETLPRLPDFSAVRTTVEYEQPMPKESEAGRASVANQPLHEGVTEQATLRYRDGHEEEEAKKRRGRRSPGAMGENLEFIGIFGPILRGILGPIVSSALADTAHGERKLVWSRWEAGGPEGGREGNQGKVAVFHYRVAGKSRTYSVMHCCLLGRRAFRTTPEYHGELKIDPETGAILRLTMESEPGWIVEPDLQPVLPVKATGMMVEYGPVAIGTRSYICPIRSVVIIRSRTIESLTVWNKTFEIYTPYATQLNDIRYGDYHKFGAESQLLPGFEVVPEAGQSPAPAKTPPNL